MLQYVVGHRLSLGVEALQLPFTIVPELVMPHLFAGDVHETVTAPAAQVLEPPAFDTVIVYVVFEVGEAYAVPEAAGVTVPTPLLIDADEAVPEIAYERVTMPPGAIAVGDAARVQVGAIMLTVAGPQVLEPAAFVTVIVYEVFIVGDGVYVPDAEADTTTPFIDADVAVLAMV